ncbi:18947_t:CDS:2 [Gigaspora margarita]|uniref:18947_t:CDS:1 n=1 Tax=Gigaspora margarita TaxID=4874 RepID=A0ABN7USN0_GIGMA|nr:18947_t:CDS:2 [Gigaspora margarita]
MGNSHPSGRSFRSKLAKKKSLQKLINSESLKQQPIYDPSKFHLPKNDKDIDRMHEQHFLFQHIWECNFSSPIERTLHEPAIVLDVGCGPGTWLLEMSTTYPQSQFYGIDIAHAFPKEIKPGNLEFIQSDITNGIKFDDDYFDFVRMSLLATFLQEDKWVRVLRELIRVLKPGGYIEIIEHELQYNIGPCFSTLVTPCSAHGGQTGKVFEELLKSYFENTVVDLLPWYMEISKEKYLELWKSCHKEFKNRASSTKLHKFWGMKIGQ